MSLKGALKLPKRRQISVKIWKPTLKRLRIKKQIKIFLRIRKIKNQRTILMTIQMSRSKR